MNPRFKTMLYFAAVVLITAMLSVALTVTVINQQQKDRVVLDTETFQRYDSLTPLLEMIDVIEQEHYGKDITREELIEGALNGLLNCIEDPYARYFSEQKYIAFLEQMDGSYHGIGALIGQPKEQGAPVLKVYEDSPALEAGLAVGDIITQVDGEAIGGHTLEEIEILFDGQEDTAVGVAVLRGEQTLTMQISRRSGVAPHVEFKLFQQYTGYIRLDKFTGAAAEDFLEAVGNLTDRGMRCLVVDLRNNPGGELEQAITIADALLEQGTIVSVHPENGESHVYEATSGGVNVPIAILVNESSASASEIVAAAVQENGKGIVVGTTTYGKGVVQSTFHIESNNSWVKLTTSAYHTPKGNSVEGKGVVPDIDIDLAADIKELPIDQILQEDDAQLWEALDAVRAQATELEAG